MAGRPGDVPVSAAIGILLVWFIGLCLTLGFWGLVAYVLMKFASTL